MKHDPINSGKRKAVNLSLDTGVVDFAREQGINLSQVSEAALREAARQARDLRWIEENRAKMEGWNAWFEENGMPFEELRAWPWRD
ncbi:MAG: type II toxin-antitoxin system CcdA family antitoxin [Sphingomonas taxi]